MLKLDKKFLEELESTWVQKIKVFFYEAGCSGKKVDILIDDFEVDESLELLQLALSPLRGELERGFVWVGIICYVPKTDIPHLENARITRTIKADHTGKQKIRYILTSDQVQDRCWCGSSFSFEKKTSKNKSWMTEKS